MKKATFYVPKGLLNNEVFNFNSPANRDNCLDSYIKLKDELKNKGYDLSTQDINPSELSEFVLYMNMPKTKPVNKNSFVILYESEVIRPDNWDISKHQDYTKIFTWNDEYVDNKKYFKLNFTFSPEGFEQFFSNKKRKFCTLIAGNKKNNHSLELYSQRVKAIEWFEKNAPDEFEFFGVGWDKYFFSPPWHRLNRFNFLRTMIPVKRYSSYKGMVKSKLETLSQYNFCICYENAHSIPGYITEKIFDCFFAGTIPLYWGPPNRDVFIPRDCYIDRTNFKTFDEAYHYMKSLKEEDISKYKANIKNYLQSEAAKDFYSSKFTEVIIEQTTNA